MIIKEVKNYSGRLRINITAKDNIQPNEDVILMTVQEYEDIKETIIKLQKDITILGNEAEILRQSLQEQEDKLEDIIQIALKPINKHYDSELQKKQDIIDSKDKELNNIKAVLNKFTTSISGLSLWDIVRGRHKELINEFHDSIWVNVPMDQVKDVEKLPNPDD